mgnify:CR=1 FL=1
MDFIKNIMWWLWRRKWLLLFLIVLIFVIITIRSRRAESIANNPDLLYPVVRMDLVDQIELAGRIESRNKAELAFSQSGRINKVYVQEGDLVDAGARIASLSMGQLYADISAAKASLAIARSQADDSAIGESLTYTNKQSAIANIDRVTNEQNAFVASAKKNLLTNDLRAYSTEELNTQPAPTISGSYIGEIEGEIIVDVYASKTKSGYSYHLSGTQSGTYSGYVNQPGQLGNSGLYVQFASNENYSNTTWVIPVPNTRSSTYQMNKNAYAQSLVAKENAIRRAKEELKRLDSADMTSTSNDQARARIRQAQAQLNGLYSRVRDGEIRAPFTGTIASLEVVPGESAGAFAPVVTMIGDDGFDLSLKVPEIDVARMRVGMDTDIVLDAYPGNVWQGNVTFIESSETFVDGVPVYETSVEILGAPEELAKIRSGMSARAKLITAQVNDVIALPKYIINTREDGLSFVTVKIGEEETEERLVDLGFEGSNGNREIISGLQESDVVIIPSLDTKRSFGPPSQE